MDKFYAAMQAAKLGLVSNLNRYSEAAKTFQAFREAAIEQLESEFGEEIDFAPSASTHSLEVTAAGLRVRVRLSLGPSSQGSFHFETVETNVEPQRVIPLFTALIGDGDHLEALEGAEVEAPFDVTQPQMAACLMAYAINAAIERLRSI
jgi:hypothetical protein